MRAKSIIWVLTAVVFFFLFSLTPAMAAKDFEKYLKKVEKECLDKLEKKGDKLLEKYEAKKISKKKYVKQIDKVFKGFDACSEPKKLEKKAKKLDKATKKVLVKREKGFDSCDAKAKKLHKECPETLPSCTRQVSERHIECLEKVQAKYPIP